MILIIKPWVFFGGGGGGSAPCGSLLPQQELNPGPWQVACGVLTTGLPDNSQTVLLPSGVGQASLKYFQSAEEARHAIEAVLSADPRSVYRRKLCQDRLFYFTVDTAHVTCWFGDGFAEVLRIKLASEPVPMSKAAESPGSLGS